MYTGTANVMKGKYWNLKGSGDTCASSGRKLSQIKKSNCTNPIRSGFLTDRLWIVDAAFEFVLSIGKYKKDS